ncbi:hypothetical protein SEVIR_5G363151v4 [Setaria viridis]
MDVEELLNLKMIRELEGAHVELKREVSELLTPTTERQPDSSLRRRRRGRRAGSSGGRCVVQAAAPAAAGAQAGVRDSFVLSGNGNSQIPVWILLILTCMMTMVP